MYIHPVMLALGLRLPMTKFVRSILIFYGVSLSQLLAMTWRTVLGFEALYDLYAPETYHCKVFSTAYLLRKTTLGARYFVPHSGMEKIIVNIVESDHGMRKTVVQVSGSWDANLEDESGAIPIV